MSTYDRGRPCGPGRRRPQCGPDWRSDPVRSRRSRCSGSGVRRREKLPGLGDRDPTRNDPETVEEELPDGVLGRSGVDGLKGEGSDAPRCGVARSSRVGGSQRPGNRSNWLGAGRGQEVAWSPAAGRSRGMPCRHRADVGARHTGFVVGFDRPELLDQPEMQALVDRLGISMQMVMAAGLLVPMAAVSAIAILLFWRRSDDWMAMLFSLQMITSIAFTTRSLSALEQWLPMRCGPSARTRAVAAYRGRGGARALAAGADIGRSWSRGAGSRAAGTAGWPPPRGA